MSLEPGSSIGPYSIVREIGRGGMGVVYLARDPRLDRDVAIKALPEHLALDADRLTRFQSEARTLAQLNSQSIAGIHGVEEVNGHHFLVLEYVEGESLADRLDRGPLPVDDALEICGKIAAGLEAAHDAGVIHRDLKPDNVRITPTGEVKVLDFGLAKTFEGSTSGGSSRPESHSPTMTAAQAHSPTVPGMILGTAPYMSPEQARGRRVDKRTDIWSFGVVLYECLTGRNPFRGETAQESIGAILHREADLSLLPQDTPQAVRRVLRRCLERDTSQRYRDIGDVRIELDEALRRPGGDAIPEPKSSPRSTSGKLAWSLVALLGALWIATSFLRNSPPPRRSFHLSIPTRTAEYAEENGGMISPDGQWVALSARAHDGKWGIAIRELTTGATSFLPESQAFRGLCWSHDSKEILVQEGNRLLALDVASGTVREVTVKVGSLFGATWNADDVVLFGIDGEGIHRVSALGGSAEKLIHPDPNRGETSVTYPYFLPDGNRFLYLARQYPDGVVHTLRAGALDSTETTLVGEIASSFALLESGYLLHVADGTLMATRFDPDGLELSGRPFPIAHGVWFFKPAGITLFSAARDGTLLYRKRAINKSLVWFDAAGVQQEVLIDRGEFKGFEISPDDDQAAIAIVDPRDGTSDIWLHGLNRGTASRFTVAPGEEAFPVWMPDGRSIVFSWERRDAPDIFVKSLDGTGEETLLIGTHPVEFPSDVSPDGRHLLYFSNFNEPEWDVWTVEIGDPGSARLLVEQPATRAGGHFSPDGRLVAYGSDETGRWQTWVRPFTSPGRAVQITTDGATAGRWARRGRTLYYANGKSLYAVDLSTEDGLTKPQPHLLFETPHPINGFDVTGDGRFLVELRDDSIVEPLHVIVNWSPPEH